MFAGLRLCAIPRFPRDEPWGCPSLASPKGREDSFPFHSDANTALTFFLIYLQILLDLFLLCGILGFSMAQEIRPVPAPYARPPHGL
jgi:hypothetical protein